MTFEYPILLYLSPVVAVLLALFFRWSSRTRARLLERFAASRLLPGLLASHSPAMRAVKHGCVVTAVLLIVLALARPQVGYEWREVTTRGVDVVFAVDASRSMLAEDVRPNRLERVRLAVFDLLPRLKGDRIGLVAFAGTSFLQCPLTLDYDAFRQSLEAVDTQVIPQGGTNIGAAIREAVEALGPGQNHKAVVLLTDGEDLEESAVEAAREAAKAGVAVFTVGVGTPDGELIPVRNERGQIEYVRDVAGQIVKSRLDEATLRRVAEAAGGFYVGLGARGEGLQQAYQAGVEALPKEESGSRLQRQPLERFQWPLAVAIGLLALESLLGTRRWESRPRLGRWFARAALVAAALGLAATVARAAAPEEALLLYQEGKYEEAGSAFSGQAKANPKDARFPYNAGASLYRAGDYKGAAEAFSQALSSADLSLQQKAFYNLGNALYRQGVEAKKASPKEALTQWEAALKSYDNALDLKRDDVDSKYNRDLVQRRIEALKRELERQEKAQDGQGGENKDKQDSKNEESKNSGKDSQKDQQKGGGQDEAQKDSQQGDKGKSGNSAAQKDNQPGQGEPQESPEKSGAQSGKDEKKPEGADENKSPDSQSDKDKQAQKGREPQASDKQQPAAGADRKEESGKDGQKGKGDAEAAAKAAQEAGSEADGGRTAVGVMTRQEARQILESLRSMERKLPVVAPRVLPRAEGDETRKDW